jgi:hypothetical protein
MSNLEKLEKSCVHRFGINEGRKLFSLMKIIRKKDFCVATGWDSKEISISLSCSLRGTLCRIVDDYKFLIFPDGFKEKVYNLNYITIKDHLKKYGSISNYSHCSVDSFLPQNL